MNKFAAIIHENVLKEVQQEYSQRDKRKTRKNRQLARKLVEKLLDSHKDNIIGLIRDDDMHMLFILKDSTRIPVEVCSIEMYNLLAQLDIQAEYPICEFTTGRNTWKSSKYAYKIDNNNIFWIMRQDKK